MELRPWEKLQELLLPKTTRGIGWFTQSRFTSKSTAPFRRKPPFHVALAGKLLGREILRSEEEVNHGDGEEE